MYELRPYQKQAVENTIRHFQKGQEPAVIVLPTGAGKSLVIAELAKLAKGRVLILAHVKELVEQNHSKYESYGLKAGIFSAGLNKKESHHKVIFGSIQSVARALDQFFDDFTLCLIDECHRVDTDEQTQYGQVISKLKKQNPKIFFLGMTATPYRLGQGRIYEEGLSEALSTKEPLFFKKCIFELPLDYMIKKGYLVKPIKIDIPITCYDFSELTTSGRFYNLDEIEEILTKQKRLTPLIIKNIIDIAETYNRQGVMIFSSTVRHAQEILSYLPKDQSQLVIGDTDDQSRQSIINDFKNKKIKYLVNVSVLTTGFDAPHVDIIALLRPTESASLYLQIIGRGLRLSPHKNDCLILDYTGMGHDIYSPEINQRRPSQDSIPVVVTCPLCHGDNHFWGKKDDQGNVVEHYGRKCQNYIEDPNSLKISACPYRFRFKICPECQHENDIAAKICPHCQSSLVDADSKLKQAKLSKNATILKPDSVTIESKLDKNGKPYLGIKYYDFDAKYLSEVHYFNDPTSFKKFHINFLRSHLKRPELGHIIKGLNDVINNQHLLRMPQFIIARKQDKFWRITEKIFSEELNSNWH